MLSHQKKEIEISPDRIATIVGNVVASSYNCSLRMFAAVLKSGDWMNELFAGESAQELFLLWFNHSGKQIVDALDQARMVGDIYWNASTVLGRACGVFFLPDAEAVLNEERDAVSPEQEVRLLHLIE